jgi:hypothetical protein
MQLYGISALVYPGCYVNGVSIQKVNQFRARAHELKARERARLY